ncbi:hypothetical protein ACIBCB_13875 [Streptomyces uncialis]|uniref:hypothetical protein n=1 Tax=Streptomyces uncialis TaxID=1048205 RepID=UPI00379E21D0
MSDETRCRAERYDRYRYPSWKKWSAANSPHPPKTACAAYLLHEEASHVQVWARWNPTGGPVHIKKPNGSAGHQWCDH